MPITISTMIGANYGSALQGYALQQAFMQYGETETVTVAFLHKNKLKRFIRKYIFPKKQSALKTRIHQLVSLVLYKKRDKKIWSFYSDNLKMQWYCSMKNAIWGERETKVFVCGSDQIWNPEYRPMKKNDIGSSYYANYCKKGKALKFSYAASLAVETLNDAEKTFYRNALEEFQVVSVREKTGMRLLSECINMPVRTDVDPVLLHKADFWKDRASSRYKNRRYILLYMLRPQEELLEYTAQIARENAMKVVYIGNYFYCKKGVECVTDAGVEDFLSAILNAEAIITNSFHATAFSVIFHKRFLSYVIARTGSRVRDFLTEIGLEKQVLDYENGKELLFKDIDFSEADCRIEKNRAKSVQYVKWIAENEKRKTNVS